MRLSILLFALLACSVIWGQELTGPQLLNKAIDYHDPEGAWATFYGQLSINTVSPDNGNRLSEVVLNLPAQYFLLLASRDGVTTSRILDKDQCTLTLNGAPEFSEDDAATHGLNCDRTKVMKDYYAYLYGLPMKLKDSGTILDPKVITKTFKGKDYLVLKVTYEKTIGKDTWYFYFDPSSYAMEVYQFFHDESLNDGEYILLSGEEEVSGIKMPKTRAWYYNKDNKYLGTDILTKATSL